MFYVISYDIPDNLRRTRIAKILEDFGDRVQYSVFECQIRRVDFLKLREKLKKLIDVSEGDSLRFYFLCESDVKKIERFGGISPWPEDLIII